MTYVPALATARPLGQGGWTVLAYQRRGVARPQADAYATRGISPALAEQLRLVTNMPIETVEATAAVLSRGGIRALLENRRLHTPEAPGALARMLAATPAPVLRAWVHRTHVNIEHAESLHAWGVRPSTVANWVAQDPLRRPADPYLELAVTRISLGPDDANLDAWVRLCTRHRIPFAARGNTLLSGDPALMIGAGLSLREADRLLRTGRVDRDNLAMLAGLRR